MIKSSDAAISDTYKILKIGDGIFIFSVLAQLGLTLLTFFCVAGISVWMENRENQSKILAVFSHYQQSISESIYIDEITKATNLNEATRSFHDELKNQGISADISIADNNPNESTLSIPLSIGNRILKNKIYIKPKTRFLNSSVSWLFIASLTSLGLITLVWLTMRRKVQRNIVSPLLEHVQAHSRAAAVGRLAEQVAHDIRSPISLLSAISSNSVELTDSNRRLLKLATERINEISNQLSSQSKLNFPQITLLTVLKNIIEEKEILYGPADIKFELKFDPDLENFRSPINTVELGRAVSNLLDNSAESLNSSENKLVCVSLKRKTRSNFIEIEVLDKGSGIPETIVGKLGYGKVSIGKIHGNGLGLLHARELVESVGGSIRINSKVKTGTSVFLELPAHV